MKMTNEDYTALLQLLRDYPLNRTEEDYAKLGHSPLRWRWDNLWAVPFPKRQQWFDRGIYAYLGDTHIDTVLKKALKELSHASL